MNRLRMIKTHTMVLDAEPEAVFPLLCPVREYDWIEAWRGRMIYSGSGFAEQDCIFQTDFPKDGATETWVICRYEPPRLIEFVRVSTLRATRYTITLHPTAGGKTEAEWRQVITGLTEDGDCLVGQEPEEAYPTQMERLAQMLNHYLNTGRMLSYNPD
ncbi:MAG: SRPBCC family protein [candidate division NC10 bacterium]|nr:SRPBCC family protein [candidate division NC10 bacterium]